MTDYFSSSPLPSHCSHDRSVCCGHCAGVDVTGVAHAVVRGLKDQDDGWSGVVGGFLDRHRCHLRVNTGGQDRWLNRPKTRHRLPVPAFHHQLVNDLLRDRGLASIRGASDCRHLPRRHHRNRPYVHRRDSREVHQR